MKSENNKLIVLMILIVLLVATECATILLSVSRIENMDSQLTDLSEENEDLKDSIRELNQSISESVEIKYSDDYIEEGNEETDSQFRYLAIGNSITKHPVCDYWWDEMGMAASRPENDYYHIFVEKLKEDYETVESDAVFFKDWEVNREERGNLLFKLDEYLDKKPDLITIQLSENACGISVEDEMNQEEQIASGDEEDLYVEFYDDFKKLINYIKKKTPDSRIILIDDYWSEKKSDLKRDLSEDVGVEFVSLRDVANNRNYFDCGKDTIIYGADGTEHVVDTEGTAMHPGDNGMKFIADALIKCFKNAE